MSGRYVFFDAVTGEFICAVTQDSVLKAIDEMNWLENATLTITQIVHYRPGSEDEIDHVSWLCRGTQVGHKVFEYSIIRAEFGYDH